MAVTASRRRKRHWLADWRSVRAWEGDTREMLKKRHALWFHGWCIGALVLLAMWGVSHVQMAFGLESLALRYATTLGVGYAVFLAVLRVWAGMLLDEEPPGDAGDAADAADLALDAGLDIAEGVARGGRAVMRSGTGGDFGGGGAEGLFSDAAEAGGSMVGEAASGAFEAVGSADEGAIVVIPLLAVFAIASLVVLGFGSLLLLYFGSEVLMAVALEIAFGYVSARTAVKLAREGWLSTAVRLTWKPLLGALFCAVALGLVLDHFVPQARSLPHAIELIAR